ncbi:ATP-dependent DNA helicase RecG [Candidatus Saccharibacteria bacterium]|nr:ATP-dependent DNA helicase RecG [Candidatus Saccharibacteria bacterium]
MDLTLSVENLKGVGPKTAEILKKYGIRTVRDFFYNLPRDYENYEQPVSISEIRPGKIVIKGKIDQITTRRARRRNLTVTEGIISDNTGSIKVIWFNQSYRTRQFTPDKEYYFTGDYELKNGRYSLISPSAALVTDIDTITGLSPIYVAHGALKSHDFRRLIANSRDKFSLIPDLLPTVKPKTRQNALFGAHFPSSMQSIKDCRNYLAYEELFELILAAKLNKRENEKLKSTPINFNLNEVKDFLARLPFTLTNAQKKAAWEIIQNMQNSTPMNRLLQGDVGSGKTMVAALAAYEAVLSGTQVALLAPTAILAQQHYNTLKNTLEPFKITVALLTGATKDKKNLKTNIKNGKINLVIGTHALLTDDTEFNNLALVIIDEQHRFGVEQRQKLMLKSPSGLAPHLLAMTATPIPRSLQLTIFGDLDVSILNELPKGRQPITTKILKETDIREQLYPKITEIIKSGQQVYWICKAIDDDPRTETTSVKSRSLNLQKLFPKYKIEFLHGRMKPAEKDEIMGRFKDGKTDILVSTTVVEVGVDVPNANLMIIENAENYGLAQIHQLRGRVGRGDKAAFCYLLTASDMNPSRRLRELEKSTDGFHLAEIDLKLRGPGEIYGVLQHGALDLRIASLSDTKLIHRAQKDVAEFLQNPENMLKYKELMNTITKYQQITTLN